MSHWKKCPNILYSIKYQGMRAERYCLTTNCTLDRENFWPKCMSYNDVLVDVGRTDGMIIIFRKIAEEIPKGRDSTWSKSEGDDSSLPFHEELVPIFVAAALEED